MATVAAVIASTHHRFYYRASTATGEDRPPFALGSHNFLLLTLFIALFERDYDEPLAFQRHFAARLGHWTLPYPDISS
jgi:hypothetical protein